MMMIPGDSVHWVSAAGAYGDSDMEIRRLG